MFFLGQRPHVQVTIEGTTVLRQFGQPQFIVAYCEHFQKRGARTIQLQRLFQGLTGILPVGPGNIDSAEHDMPCCIEWMGRQTRPTQPPRLIHLPVLEQRISSRRE